MSLTNEKYRNTEMANIGKAILSFRPVISNITIGISIQINEKPKKLVKVPCKTNNSTANEHT